jgi:hypothetical protein
MGADDAVGMEAANCPSVPSFAPSFANGPTPIRPLPPVDMWGNPIR